MRLVGPTRRHPVLLSSLCRCPSAFSCLGARGAGPIMTDFFVTGRNWEHTLAVVLFLARASDVGSIYLVTPSLRLVANPIARKLGWPFILLTLGLCAMPYYNTAYAMILIAWSLFATASNLSRAWIVRGLGEVEYLRVLRQAATARPLREAIA